MTQAEMFLASFMRPSSYFELSAESQWATDKSLGILDWDGSGANGPMTPEEKERFEAHYDYFKKKRAAKETKDRNARFKATLEMIAELGDDEEHDGVWAAYQAKCALEGVPGDNYESVHRD